MVEPTDDPVGETGELTLARVAARAGVSPATIKRWVDGGLIPGFDGSWTPAAAAYARVIARLRARGHTLERIKRAGENGQLAVGPLENLLSSPGPRHPLREAARVSGLDAGLIERLYTTMGLGVLPADGFSDEDLQVLKYASAVLDAGLPLAAFLQLMRVYGQAVAQIADAEVRLIHLYVHEPLMRSGVASVEIADEMEGLMRDTLPFAAPFMNYLHGRLLAQFVEQDMIGHMEADLGADALEEGRLRVAIAFADLAGYARLTVERGDEAALGRGRALREVGRTDAAGRRARDQDARRRGDGRGFGRGGADGMGGRAAARGSPTVTRCRGSASTTARCCIATVTTTGATSTRRRAWWRARAAARCW